MFYKPLAVDRTEGVYVYYGPPDVEALAHLLDFLVRYMNEHDGEITLLPSISINNRRADIEELHRLFSTSKVGERKMKGTAQVLFLNEMKLVFLEYLGLMKNAKREAENLSIWGKGYALFTPYEMYKSIQEEFFPEKSSLH